MPVEDQVSPRTCGCGRSLAGRRANAETCSDACRIKKHRRDNPPIPAGPLLFLLINTYQRKLEAKTAKARESFAPIAKALTPLAHRHLLTIEETAWESWLAKATEGMGPSTRALWLRYLHAMAGRTPHFLPATPTKPARPPVDRAASHVGLLASERRPKTERAQLVLELVAAGLYRSEIQALQLNEQGHVRVKRSAWGRKSMPTIPPALQDRLMDYAADQDLCSGDFLFTISKQAITQLVRRWLPRQTPCSSSVAAPQTA